MEMEEVLVTNFNDYGGDLKLLLQTTPCGSLIESVEFHSFDPMCAQRCNLIVCTQTSENAKKIASTLDNAFIWGSVVRAYYPKSIFPELPCEDEPPVPPDGKRTPNEKQGHGHEQRPQEDQYRPAVMETTKSQARVEDTGCTEEGEITEDGAANLSFPEVSPEISESSASSEKWNQKPVPLLELRLSPETSRRGNDNQEPLEELHVHPIDRPFMHPVSCRFCYDSAHDTWDCPENGEYIRISKSADKGQNICWPEISIVKLYGLHAGPVIKYIEKSHLKRQELPRELIRIFFAFLATDCVCLRCGTSGHLSTPLPKGTTGLCHHLLLCEDVRDSSFCERQKFCREVLSLIRRVKRGMDGLRGKVSTLNTQFRRLNGIREESLISSRHISPTTEENLVVTVACNAETDQYDQPDAAAVQAAKRRRPGKHGGDGSSPPPRPSILSRVGRRIVKCGTGRASTGIATKGYWANK